MALFPVEPDDLRTTSRLTCLRAAPDFDHSPSRFSQ
jgi:hypothetical protein